METFVDSDRFQGTCYKACGWQALGKTRGFAKAGNTYYYHGRRKIVFVKILDHRFREQLDVIPRPLPTEKKKGRDHTMMLSVPDYDPDILKTCGLTETDIPEVAEMLQTYLETYKPCYKRSDQKRLADTFIKGLLSDLDRKSIEPIALRYNEYTSVRSLQMFFKKATFDDDKMLSIYHSNLLGLIGEKDGMLNVDGSDFPKKGTNSVGVARQHCGVLGKTDNCQAGVFLGYSSTKGYGLLDRRLYMPEKWFSPEYVLLRKKCAVPEDLAFYTKNQLAAMMIQEVTEKGNIPYKWIGCDAAFGVDRTFLESLPNDCHYFADVHADSLVFPHMPDMVIPPKKSNKGRPFKYKRPTITPVRVDTYAADENIPWQKVILAEGAKGPIIAEVKCLRVVGCSSTTKYGNYIAPTEWVWLYIRRYANGRIKYSLCNAPEDTPIQTLHRVATMRWPIEQCFKECKSYLGMGHYETRSYKAWHRHMLFVMMAHLFTLMLRLHFKKNGCFNHAYGEKTDCSSTMG